MLELAVQKVASGVTYDINRIKSGGPVDPVLSASGGLIGYDVWWTSNARK